MVTVEKGGDFEVVAGTQDKFWMQAVDLLWAKFLGKVCLGLFSKVPSVTQNDF